MIILITVKVNFYKKEKRDPEVYHAKRCYMKYNTLYIQKVTEIICIPLDSIKDFNIVDFITGCNRKE